MSLELVGLVGAALLAGFVDAVAGGGGLIQLPALMAVLPDLPVALLLGTNKAAAACGTSVAVTQYVRRVPLARDCLLGALPFAIAGAWLGANAVSCLPTQFAKPLILLALVGVAFHTWRQRRLGTCHAPRWQGRTATARGALLGLGIGFYDGIFGPGTGTWLVFALVRGFGHDFLHASANAKAINLATNLGALALFAWRGNVWWAYAVAMGLANMLGAALGSRAALRGGVGFVRSVFLAVLVLLVAKVGIDVLSATMAMR